MERFFENDARDAFQDGACCRWHRHDPTRRRAQGPTFRPNLQGAPCAEARVLGSHSSCTFVVRCAIGSLFRRALEPSASLQRAISCLATSRCRRDPLREAGCTPRPLGLLAPKGPCGCGGLRPQASLSFRSCMADSGVAHFVVQRSQQLVKPSPLVVSPRRGVGGCPSGGGDGPAPAFFGHAGLKCGRAYPRHWAASARIRCRQVRDVGSSHLRLRRCARTAGWTTATLLRHSALLLQRRLPVASPILRRAASCSRMGEMCLSSVLIHLATVVE